MVNDQLVILTCYYMYLQKHFLSKIHKIRVNLNWALELKVLIVLCYYVLLGTAVLTIFTKALIDLQNFLEKGKNICIFVCIKQNNFNNRK